MFKNYIVLALRNIKKQKAFSIINLSGLAIGMACCILIFMFITDELSYDRFHINADSIYRISADGDIGGARRQFAVSPGPIGPTFKKDIPGILDYTRVINLQILQQGETQIKYEEKSFEETGIFFVDSTFFNVFSAEYVAGDPVQALTQPNTVIITESIAKKIFGDEDPIGKMISYTQLAELEVKAVVKDVPKNSHFRYNYLVSLMSLPNNLRLAFLANWMSVGAFTYVTVDGSAELADVKQQIDEIFERRTRTLAKQFGISMHLVLDKMTDIHLHSNLEFEMEANSDIAYIYIFSAVAIFVLLIACINFMNLSTARSTNRAREVGMRKVFGAYKSNLVTQFLGESMILSILGMVIAIVIVFLALPYFNGISGKELTFDFLNNPQMALGLAGMMVLTGLLAGSYPAFFLSAFRPIAVIRGTLSSGSRKSMLRISMVIFQFTISIVLIISTFIVLNQLKYMKTKDLGFDKEQILVVLLKNRDNIGKGEMLRNEIKKNPDVIDVTFSSSIPGRNHAAPLFKSKSAPQDENQIVDVIFTEWDFVETYNMEMAEGRSFSRDFISDTLSSFVINETAAKKFGWTTEEAIGQDLIMVGGGRVGKVIGVVKDFHAKSVKQVIGPTVLMYLKQAGSQMSVRFNAEKVTEVMDFMIEKWRDLEPGRERDYFFLDEDFDKNYRFEETLSDIFKYFAFLAIFIACLGLFGLASFTAEQRTREIGIRKVLGASSNNLVVQIGFDFTKWVVIANVFAWPLTFFLMSNYWLSNFPYNVGISLSTFVVSGVMSIVIALLTVSYQSIKAATANPVEALRAE